MNNVPKHRKISRQLASEIMAGRFAPGDKLPSEAQLVKKHNVSRPTVGRAFRELEKDGIIERRSGSGTYVRAAGAVTSESRTFGLLIPGLGTTEIFQIICSEIASLARVKDYGILWGGSTNPLEDTDISLNHAEELCRQFIARRLSGVFFAPAELMPGQAAANRKLAESLREAAIPVVLLDRDLVPYPSRSDFDLVGIDNDSGGYMLAEHLIKLGCRRILFVARPMSAPTVDARIAGAREALIRNGVELAPNWVRFGDPADIKFVRSLIAGGGADAFICANDNTAAVLMRAVEAEGFSVPERIRVVGFDDVKYATLVSPPLTTIHQPCRELAVMAFRTMLERLAEPTLCARRISLAPYLVVRESCGAYLSSAKPSARARNSETPRR